MAKLLLRGLLALGLMTAVAAPTVEAKSTGASTQASSGTIEKRVSKRLRADHRLAKQDINVSVDESGEAKLTGTVNSKAAKDRAGEITGGVKGVKQVDNQLEIRSKSSGQEQGAPEDDGEQDQAGEDDRQSAQGEAAPGAQAAKETMSDPWITVSLKSQLITAEPEAFNVSVETRNGVVTLSGTVGSAAVRARALNMARNTDGAREVVDNLKVVAPKSRPEQ